MKIAYRELANPVNTVGKVACGLHMVDLCGQRALKSSCGGASFTMQKRKPERQIMYWFDNTRIQSIRKCEMHYALRHILGYVPVKEYEPFVVGRAYHDLWEKRLKNEPLPDLDYEYTKPENSPYNVSSVFEEWYKRERPSDMVLMVESPWKTELAPGFWYYAKCDLVCSDSEGRPYPIDHKTTSAINKTFWEQFKYSPQLMGYCVATGSKKAAINACEKVLLRRDKSRKCRTHGVPFSECTLKHIKTETRFFYYTEDQLKTWRSAILEYAKHVASLELVGYSIGVIPKRNIYACPCEYEEYCWDGADLNNPQEFKIEKWDIRSGWEQNRCRS